MNMAAPRVHGKPWFRVPGSKTAQLDNSPTHLGPWKSSRLPPGMIEVYTRENAPLIANAVTDIGL